MTQQQADYITEAMELLKGEPAAIIEQPRSRLVLRNGIGEEWTVAWVKLSTAFKPHIKEIRGAPLAVWLYIALSVNKQGVSFPSINKIADDTGYSRNGVMDAIKVLEEKGYLKVRRGERRYNLYEPEFAAIGRTNEPSDESTQLTNPPDESTFQPDESTFQPDESTFSPNESSTLDSNKRNKRVNKIKEGASAKPPTPPEVLIFREVTSRYPNKVNYPDIEKIVQSVSARLLRPATADDLRPFFAAWTARGFNPLNIAWMGWAVDGGIPQQKQSSSNQDNNQRLLQAFAAKG